MTGGREIEIKLRVADQAEARRRLRRAGFRLKARRLFETNRLYDTAALDLRGRGALLRIRRSGKRAVLTYKGPPEPGRHKSREEIETTLGDPGRFEEILDRLGFRRVFRYDKYRTEYSDGEGLATLDETPIGVFLELEGEPCWIDSAARRLDFSEENYITASYARLYFEHCEREGRAPADMVFPPASLKRGRPPR